jgi:hypothetical protein
MSEAVHARVHLATEVLGGVALACVRTMLPSDLMVGHTRSDFGPSFKVQHISVPPMLDTVTSAASKSMSVQVVSMPGSVST